MFLVDVSKSMGKTRIVELPEGPNGEERTAEITNLQWGLQYVKLKIQEMVGLICMSRFGCLGRVRYTTEERQINVALLYLVQKVRGVRPQRLSNSNVSQDTDNIVNQKNGGYENVSEYIHIAQPNAATLAKLDRLEPSETTGDRECIFPHYHFTYTGTV